MTAVETALDSLVASIEAAQPGGEADYEKHLLNYLYTHPAFYGAAAALLDSSGTATASPYAYGSVDGGYTVIDLAQQPGYNIQEQGWLVEPLAADAGVWTEPYFDAGGGEIWMISRSVPARDSLGVFAIITTDLPVKGPSK